MSNSADAAGNFPNSTADAAKPAITSAAGDVGPILPPAPLTEIATGGTVDDAPARILPQFHYPVLRHHTGKLQYRIDRAESVTIDRLGEVRRGGVVAVKNENFARGLIVGGSFANAPADAPVGPLKRVNPTGAQMSHGVASTLTVDGVPVHELREGQGGVLGTAPVDNRFGAPDPNVETPLPAPKNSKPSTK